MTSDGDPVLEGDPVLRALWTKVLNSWSEDDRHKGFIAYCRELNKLDEAARRYRTVVDGTETSIESTPEVIEDAKKRLTGIAMIAVATLQADRTEPGAPGMHRKVRFAGYIVFILLMGLLAYALTPALRGD
ncbi:MAG: hypothetical protein HOV80_09395 [Polyangiaceae bacterium]|nr:hypothetical protein [Polyangiaceae bacterium]